MVVAIVLGALLSTQVQAQRVDAVVSQDSVRIGERFLLTITALHGFAEEPEFPVAANFGDLEDVSVVSRGHAVLGASARLDSVVFDVTVFALDSAVVPRLPVTLHGGTRTDSTPRLVIPVVSVVPAEADSIRPMAEAVQFAAPQGVRPPWPWVLLGLAALIVLGLLWYWYTRKRTEVIDPEPEDEPEIPPYDVAMERLQELESMELPARMMPYFIALSETVRTYLEGRIDVTALEMTTREILDQIAQVRYKVPAGVPDLLRSTLGLSDLVKFAEYSPTVEESRNALAAARTVIERLEEKQLQLAADQARLEAQDR